MEHINNITNYFINMINPVVVAEFFVDGMPWMNALRAATFCALWVILWRQPTSSKLGRWTNALFLFTFLTSIHVAYLAYYLTAQADGNDVQKWNEWALVIGLNFLPLAASVAGVGVVVYTLKENTFTVSHEGVFGTLAQALPIIVADHKGIIRYATKEIDLLVGCVPSTLIDKRLETIMPDRYESDHQFGIDRYVKTREPHIIGKVSKVELKRADGTEVPIYLALNSTDVDGNPWFIATIWPAEDALKAREDKIKLREEAQDETAVIQAATTKTNTERAYTLSKMGIDADEKRTAQRVQQKSMDLEQRWMDEDQKKMDAERQTMDDEKNAKDVPESDPNRADRV